MNQRSLECSGSRITMPSAPYPTRQPLTHPADDGHAQDPRDGKSSQGSPRTGTVGGNASVSFCLCFPSVSCKLLKGPLLLPPLSCHCHGNNVHISHLPDPSSFINPGYGNLSRFLRTLLSRLLRHSSPNSSPRLQAKPSTSHLPSHLPGPPCS